RAGTRRPSVSSRRTRPTGQWCGRGSRRSAGRGRCAWSSRGSGTGASSSCPASTVTIVSFPRPAAGPIIRPSGGSGTTQRNESWKTCGDRRQEEEHDAMTVMLEEQARLLAATTVARNVVVTASAATGQTTLLITRLMHLLVKSPEAV